MIWKKVERNQNYSINEHGEIRNDVTGKVRAPSVNSGNGYTTVDLWKDNKRKKYTVHRLLAEAFIPNPDGKPTVDHKDGNRSNNALQNLRWASYSEQNSRFNTAGVRSQRIKVTHYAEKRKKRGGGHLEWICADNVMYFDRITDVADYFSLSICNISI